MTGEQWLDLASLVCVIVGASFSLVAGIGLLRFQDMLSRLHAQAKPQSTGLLFVLVGLALHEAGWHVLFLVLAILVLQYLTTPMAGMMLARSGYRSSMFDESELHVDELATAVERAERAAAAEAIRSGRAPAAAADEAVEDAPASPQGEGDGAPAEDRRPDPERS